MFDCAPVAESTPTGCGPLVQFREAAVHQNAQARRHLCDVLADLVLPHAGRQPTRRSEICIYARITLAIGQKLLAPEGRIPLRRSIVARASVPEAPVDEYSHPGSSEDEVWRAWKPYGQSIPGPGCPERVTDCQFARRAGPTDSRHLF